MGYTRILMSTSALIMCVLGMAGTFAPDALLRIAGAPESAVGELLVQTMGAMYLGFAALNWMGRNNLIGGIYSRPVAVANLMHFLVAGIAMVKFAASHSVPWYVLLIIVAYALFAGAFAVVLGRHPIQAT